MHNRFQFLFQGQLVVIPAGCAHQVRNGSSGWNIKVAQDFIAPQSAGVCLQLLSEVRYLIGRKACEIGVEPHEMPLDLKSGWVV